MQLRRRASIALLVAAAAVAAAAPAPSAAAPVATFESIAHPALAGHGEPSIGVNRETGAVMFQAGLDTFTVTELGTAEPRWRESSSIATNTTSFDPILTTDAVTGRTFVSQLTLACSLMAYTDDDGASWQPVPAGCGAGSFFDHQSVGTGAFVAGGTLRPVTSYPRAVYYCAQAIAFVNCATSLDGGLNFLPATHAWSLASCSGLHGHLSSAPDGTVYVPPRECDGAAVAVSDNNGMTWSIRRVPDTSPTSGVDPSVASGSDGTTYLAWAEGVDGGKVPHVAATRDRGVTWSAPVALGTEFGISNTAFIAAVAGDGDRAAVAFVGTPTGGNNQTDTFDGVWRLYVALTYDRGEHWHTVLATPQSPVQVGKICTGGIGCTGNTRNLLDFIGATVDLQGRVLVGFADGCLEESCTTADRHTVATIARQSSGRTLYRAYDGRLG